MIESLRTRQPSDQPTEYVCGFLFDEVGKAIALIRKKYPPWQSGYLNGLGGELEGEETPLQAMTREFEEEAGIRVDDWAHFCTLRTVDARIHWFTFRLRWGVDDTIRSKTAELVQWYSIDQLDTLDLIPNTRWLIVMAMLGPDGVLGNMWPYDIYEPSEGPK